MRGLSHLDDDPVTWQTIQDHGSFTAADAHEMGLIDYMPPLDPLDQLVDSTKSDDAKENMTKKWGKNTDMHNFTATEAVSLAEYTSLLAKRKFLKDRSWRFYAVLKDLAEKSTATRACLKAFGYESPFFNIDEVRLCRNQETRLFVFIRCCS